MADFKGDNLWRGFGLAQSPNNDSRLNRQRVSRAIFSVLFIMRGAEKRRLRCLGVAPGVVGLGAFAGNPFAVQPGFNREIERGGGESKFPLRDRQAAAVAFHGSIEITKRAKR